MGWEQDLLLIVLRCGGKRPGDVIEVLRSTDTSIELDCATSAQHTSTLVLLLLLRIRIIRLRHKGRIEKSSNALAHAPQLRCLPFRITNGRGFDGDALMWHNSTHTPTLELLGSTEFERTRHPYTNAKTRPPYWMSFAG